MNPRTMAGLAAAASMILTVAAPAAAPGPGEGKKSRMGRLTPTDPRDARPKPKSDSLARMLSRAKRRA